MSSDTVSATVSAPRIRKRLLTGLKLLVVMGAIGFAYYWITSAPVVVKHHRIARGPIRAEVMGTGTLEARTKVTISPKISGRLAQVLADQGDEVGADQLLAQLDDADLRQQVRIAEATIAFAEASLGRFQADRDQAASILAQAESEFQRTSQLAQSQSVSQAELDKAQEGWDVAKAGVARAEAANVEAQSQVVLAQRTLAYHQARLADGKLVAPFAGLIIERLRDPGSIAIPGTAVLSLASTDELWVSAWVDETQMARVEQSQGAKVVFRSQPSRTFPGQVARLGRQADRETREFVVDVRVLELPKNWAIGQRAEVYIEVDSREDVLWLPKEFLLTIDAQKGVYVQRDGRAHWRPVTIGLASNESVEIIDGLAEGDQVVVPVDRKQSMTGSRKVKLR
jgi:RND family efflux transporter MFP subunit